MQNCFRAGQLSKSSELISGGSFCHFLQFLQILLHFYERQTDERVFHFKLSKNPGFSVFRIMSIFESVLDNAPLLTDSKVSAIFVYVLNKVTSFILINLTFEFGVFSKILSLINLMNHMRIKSKLSNRQNPKQLSADAE